jgi:hypothetical protein
VGPRASLNVFGEEKNLWPLPGFEPQTVCSPYSLVITEYAISALLCSVLIMRERSLESQEGLRLTELVNPVFVLEGIRKPRRLTSITDIQAELRTRIYQVRGRSAK